MRSKYDDSFFYEWNRIAVFAPQPEPPQQSLIHPWTAFGCLLVVAIALSIWDWRRKRLSTWFDVILLITVGLLGTVLLLLWTATDHNACARNFNLLWALPTQLIGGAFLLRKSKPGWLKIYFCVTAGVDLLLLLAWPILPQLLSYFLIPVVATLFVRAVTLFRLLPSAR